MAPMTNRRDAAPTDPLPLPPEVIRYSEILSRDPRSLLFALLAEAYRKCGMVDEAIRVCRFGLGEHPGYTGGRVALARAYYEKGMLKEARDELKGVLDLFPDNLASLRLMGMIHKREGEWEDAQQVYQTILFYYPNDSGSLEEIGYLSRIMKAGEPTTGDTAAGRSYNGRSIATKTMAELYIRQGYFRNAYEIYSEMLSEDPGDEEIRARLIKLRSAMGEEDGRSRG